MVRENFDYHMRLRNQRNTLIVKMLRVEEVARINCRAQILRDFTTFSTRNFLFSDFERQ